MYEKSAPGVNFKNPFRPYASSVRYLFKKIKTYYPMYTLVRQSPRW
jgi:hypothetical protein